MSEPEDDWKPTPDTEGMGLVDKLQWAAKTLEKADASFEYAEDVAAGVTAIRTAAEFMQEVRRELADIKLCIETGTRPGLLLAAQGVDRLLARIPEART